MVTQMTKGMQIPKHAWLQMKAKGIVLPLEYTAKADSAPSELLHNPYPENPARVMATTVSRAKRRPNRKARLTMRTGDLQHAWVKHILQRRDLPVKHDALLDHGRLMHHLIHDTMAAPPGAMMDDDYAHMLRTVGGPDEGNMVAQMQSVVCCLENPDSAQPFPIETPYASGTAHLDLTAETQLYHSMLHWNDDEMYEPQLDQMDTADASDTEKCAPTAPPWDENAEVTATLQGPDTVQYDTPIQCVVTPPAHTTPAAVTVLAMVGAVFIVMAACIVLTLCWLASQGVHITGFWLTLEPSENKPSDDNNALM